MREWYAASELAGLPGMPALRQDVWRRAERAGWQSRDRDGRGGGREYHVSSLPEETRLYFAREASRARFLEELGSLAETEGFREGAAIGQAVADKEKATEQDRMKARAEKFKIFMGLPKYKQDRARARMRVLSSLEIFMAEVGVGGRSGVELFVTEYNAGAVAVPKNVRALVPHCDVTTLYRWRQRERDQGIGGLCDDYGKRAGKSKVETSEKLKTLVLGLIFKTPHIRPGHVMQYLRAGHSELVAGVSEKSIERFMRRWKNENALTYTRLTNPDAWKNKYQAAFGNAAGNVERLNQLWELDSTPADIMLLLDGKPTRHSVLGVIDIYSRRFKLLVSRTSKSTMISTLFRRALLDWGVPEAARHDNGRDYLGEHFQNTIGALQITPIICLPFKSEQKPFIERAFRTFSHGLLELLPGYIGHNVAERKALESRLSFAQRIGGDQEPIPVNMEAAQFQKFCQDWCDNVYARNSHEGLDGKTPFEMAVEWNQPVRRIEDERALDLLLAEAPKGAGRTVTKKGVNVEGATFIHGDLAPLIGQRVVVRLDPEDLGRIYVYDGAGEKFVCIAECPERTGISRTEVVIAARKAQKKALDEGRAKLKEARNAIKAADVVGVVMDHRAEEAARVTMLPRASEPHTTPQLEAAAEAARAIDALHAEPTPVHDADALERGARVIEMVSAEEQARRDREGMDAKALARLCALMTKDAENWSASDATWVEGIKASDPELMTRWKFEQQKIAMLAEARAKRSVQ